MAGINFNAYEVEPSRPNFVAIPEGKYQAMIVESKVKLTKNRDGKYLELQFVIVDGEHAGRKLWARLNIENSSISAQEIARGQLSAICHAINVMTPTDSSELHNIPLLIYVVCQERSDGKGITNDIKGYEKIEYKNEQISSNQQGISNVSTSSTSNQDDKAPWAQ